MLKSGKRETIPEKVIDALQAYHWPGNVRELENIIERAVIIQYGKTAQIRGLASEDQHLFGIRHLHSGGA